VVPNSRLQCDIKPSNNSLDDDLDRLLISCRRLCVDNHLNETLHNSIIDLNAQSSMWSDNKTHLNNQINTSNTPCISPSNNHSTQNTKMNKNIQSFYSKIPILIHDNIDTYINAINNVNNNNQQQKQLTFRAKTTGKNVRISQPDFLIAYRESSMALLQDRYFSSVLNQQKKAAHCASSLIRTESKGPTQNCYVFLDRPIEKGKFFCVQVVGIDQCFSESASSLSIGCTTCHPDDLDPAVDLPDDSNGRKK
jgi:hypothetical protein